MTFAAKDHESAKERALRIPLDYVHGTDRLQRWKWKVSIIAAVLTAVYGAWVIVAPRGVAAFSHGQLATAHAPWDTKCSACHLDFVALRPDAANPLAKFGLLGSKAAGGNGNENGNWKALRQEIDRKCQACHPSAPHHGNELAADARTCISCHTEHRGRSATISRPTDLECTRCHDDIATHRSNEKSFAVPPIENVSRFVPSLGGQVSHPEFRSLASDPGNVKFNHQMHMNAGIPASQGGGKKLLMLADLPVEFVEQYRRPGQNAASDAANAVQLECASCHQLRMSDDRKPEKTRTAIPTAGDYMLPVAYEKHCRACHPLNFEPAASKQMQHGLRPNKAKEFLYGRYASEANAVDDATTRLTPRRPIPGQGLDRATNATSANVNEKVAAAERYLYETNACGKCHLAKTTEQIKFGLIDLRESGIPQVWFRHARFSHTAHRTEKCERCHDIASVSKAPGGQDQDVVMIKGRNDCMNCHSPRAVDGQAGGAGFDCVECHKYHGILNSDFRFPISSF